MTRWLPLFLLCSTPFLGASPAPAQFVFLDTNGDQLCTTADYCWGTDVPVDVYLDTDHNMDGSPATCSTGEPLTIESYEVIFYLYKGAPGSTGAFGAWTNAVPEFTTDLGRAQSGDYLRVGYTAPPGTFLSAGKRKLGTLIVTSTPCTFLWLVASRPSAPDDFTGFYSECLGANLDNTVRLGRDFFSACGSGGVCDPVRKTTWGVIKNTYR